MANVSKGRSFCQLCDTWHDGEVDQFCLRADLKKKAAFILDKGISLDVPLQTRRTPRKVQKEDLGSLPDRRRRKSVSPAKSAGGRKNAKKSDKGDLVKNPGFKKGKEVVEVVVLEGDDEKKNTVEEVSSSDKSLIKLVEELENKLKAEEAKRAQAENEARQVELQRVMQEEAAQKEFASKETEMREALIRAAEEELDRVTKKAELEMLAKAKMSEEKMLEDGRKWKEAQVRQLIDLQKEVAAERKRKREFVDEMEKDYGSEVDKWKSIALELKERNAKDETTSKIDFWPVDASSKKDLLHSQNRDESPERKKSRVSKDDLLEALACVDDEDDVELFLEKSKSSMTDDTFMKSVIERVKNRKKRLAGERKKEREGTDSRFHFSQRPGPSGRSVFPGEERSKRDASANSGLSEMGIAPEVIKDSLVQAQCTVEILKQCGFLKDKAEADEKEIKSGETRTYKDSKKQKVRWPHETFNRPSGEVMTPKNIQPVEFLTGMMMLLEEMTQVEPFDLETFKLHLDYTIQFSLDVPGNEWPIIRESHYRVVRGWESKTLSTTRAQDWHVTRKDAIQRETIRLMHERTMAASQYSTQGGGSNQGSGGLFSKSQNQRSAPQQKMRPKPPQDGVRYSVCRDYSFATCSHPGEHLVDDVMNSHVCGFCINVLKEVRKHPEKDCDFRKKMCPNKPLGLPKNAKRAPRGPSN